MKKLVIAEKPSVAEQLAGVIDRCKKTRDYYEGENYIVSWAVGHLVGLAEPEEYDKKYKQWLLSNLPIIPEHFRFAILDGAEQRFAVLKLKEAAARGADTIATACPYCISMFEDAKTALGMDDLRIADVVELAADALQE